MREVCRYLCVEDVCMGSVCVEVLVWEGVLEGRRLLKGRILKINFQNPTF